MLMIRLSRIGKKNKPIYRLIISEKNRDIYAPSLEILGSYNPYNKDLQANGERIKYWISKGAQMSPTVNNLLLSKAIINGKKVSASRSGIQKNVVLEIKPTQAQQTENQNKTA
ncbi:30S ribosomal protein S16 [Patescibacteria group bacterium]|nr:30S ribosomal protein S16 [Patescibacteria group bacterium]